MVKIQTNLKNFSVVDGLIALFSGCEHKYQLYINKDGIIFPDITRCPCCNFIISKNGYNECKDKRVKAFGLVLKKGKVICSNPRCDFEINVSKVVTNKWIEIFSAWLESIVLSLGTKKLSSGKITQHLKETFGLSLSSEFIRIKFNELTRKIKTPSPQAKPSGIVIHDEQYVKIKGVELKRISTVDANNQNVYYDKLHENRTEETIALICCNLKKLLKKVYAAVIDGHGASKKAYEKEFIDILIQYCIFHFAKNVRDAYKESVGYGKGRSCLPLEHLIGFFSILNSFLDHGRELNHLRTLQKELNNHKQRVNSLNLPPAKKQEYIEDYKEKYAYKAAKYLRKIRNIRRRSKGIKLTLRTEEQAKQLLEKAKLENVFPKQVQKQINRLKREWKNFTHCLRDKTIPPTTNKVEQYYALTLNWIEKNNLQSEEQFYREQKFSLIKRYNIPLFRQGIFTDFLKVTFVLLLTFGVT